MADGPNVDYKPQGEGPHPTLAGNVLDPSVSADGKMQHGEGVGGADEAQIKKEGMEHIQSKVPQAQPPASSPGSGDASGGLATGSGGLSSSSNVHSPVTGETQQNSGGMFDTVKSYLGMGGASSTSETRNPGEENLDPTGSSTSNKAAEAAGFGAAATGAGAAASTMDGTKEGRAGVDPTSNSVVDKPLDSGSSKDHNTSQPSGAAKDTASVGIDPASNTASKTQTPKDSDVTTGAPPTESADPATRDTAMADTEQKEEGGHKPPQPAGKGTKGGLENKDAIPTAGGEKLGEKHWGESQIVPEVPKKQPEAEGVASKDGQPNKQTEDNTSKNTGGASGGPHHSSSGGNDEEKEKLVDKIKDKLHIGSKNKE